MARAKCDFCSTEVESPEKLQAWADEVGVTVLCKPCQEPIDEAVRKMTRIADKALGRSRISLYQRILKRGLREAKAS